MAADVERVIQAAEKTGLTLNASKCEIIASNFDIIENIDTFRDLRRVAPQHMTLQGAAAFTLPLQNAILPPPLENVDDLDKAAALSSLKFLSHAEEPAELS